MLCPRLTCGADDLLDAGTNVLVHITIVVVDKFRRHDHVDIAAEHLGRRIPKQPLACLVDDQNFRFVINEDNSVDRSVEDARKPGLGDVRHEQHLDGKFPDLTDSGKLLLLQLKSKSCPQYGIRVRRRVIQTGGNTLTQRSFSGPNWQECHLPVQQQRVFGARSIVNLPDAILFRSRSNLAAGPGSGLLRQEVADILQQDFLSGRRRRGRLLRLLNASAG